MAGKEPRCCSCLTSGPGSKGGQGVGDGGVSEGKLRQSPDGRGIEAESSVRRFRPARVSLSPAKKPGILHSGFNLCVRVDVRECVRVLFLDDMRGWIVSLGAPAWLEPGMELQPGKIFPAPPKGGSPGSPRSEKLAVHSTLALPSPTCSH
ncbi:hypothetical protein TREES_T100011699 [Tupaia chinensis]|uniref:Uncharacterized protein n=1 Tax=Tupaia chinensis TaxID=246437 RepID=L9L1A6_TUPCH|nr:hypothetical protein TREES_T100011699 [Tupaia chinensis]